MSCACWWERGVSRQGVPQRMQNSCQVTFEENIALRFNSIRLKLRASRAIFFIRRLVKPLEIFFHIFFPLRGWENSIHLYEWTNKLEDLGDLHLFFLFGRISFLDVFVWVDLRCERFEHWYHSVEKQYSCVIGSDERHCSDSLALYVCRTSTRSIESIQSARTRGLKKKKSIVYVRNHRLLPFHERSVFGSTFLLL